HPWMPPLSMVTSTSPSWHIAMPSGGGIHSIKIDPPVFVNIRVKSAEEKAGEIDGKRVEDPTMGIG
ncbi:hypothetical protein, partial [Sedimentitalea nanhaiensis]|uniref:hypothetical protein n=1 Tax=Sedimentitalea nanhaiensis TaxID=999627 RepID=UPI001C31956B